jgi:hypothetical protein
MELEAKQELDKLAAQAKSGADWFYWIAGLSIVNSAVILLGSDWGFLAGLGITQVVDALVVGVAPTATWLALVVDIAIAGACCAVGYWAHTNSKIYMAGMVLYGLDSILFLLVGDWIGVGFHGVVLFFLWGGLKARKEWEQKMAAQQPGMPMAA